MHLTCPHTSGPVLRRKADPLLERFGSGSPRGKGAEEWGAPGKQPREERKEAGARPLEGNQGRARNQQGAGSLASRRKGVGGEGGGKSGQVCIVIVKMPPPGKAGQAAICPAERLTSHPPPSVLKGKPKWVPAKMPRGPLSTLTLRKAKCAPSRPQASIYKLPFPSRPPPPPLRPAKPVS